jgi:hypothetical protein
MEKATGKGGKKRSGGARHETMKILVTKYLEHELGFKEWVVC